MSAREMVRQHLQFPAALQAHNVFARDRLFERNRWFEFPARFGGGDRATRRPIIGVIHRRRHPCPIPYGFDWLKE